MPENTLFSYYTEEAEEVIRGRSSASWSRGEPALMDRDWSGRSALRDKGPGWNNLTRVCSAWGKDALYFYFECWFEELNVKAELGEGGPVDRLWEQDVAEVFLRPKGCDDYFEIEVSPLGQWLDLHIIRPRIDVDFQWRSLLEVDIETDLESKRWRAFLRLPFDSFLRASSLVSPPLPGDAWRLNLCRIAGRAPNREFLSWRPTFTREPDFHVPASFGNLIFLRETD